MAQLRAGIPLQIPDGTFVGVNLSVALAHGVPPWGAVGSAAWRENVYQALLAAGAPGIGLVQLLDVTPDSWGGVEEGGVMVGTLGQVLDVPNLPVPRSELVPILAERFSLALDVIEAIPVYIERPDDMRWIKTQITGKLGGVEDIVHTVNWLHDGPVGSRDVAADHDDAWMQGFADLVRTQWRTALLAGTAGSRPADILSSALQYIEVRASLVQQTTATVNDGANTGKIVQQGRTFTSAFAAAGGLSGQGGGAPLPFEVAACATLRTVGSQTGGVSHGRQNRGRLYFGGLDVSLMSLEVPGTFVPASVNRLASALGAFYDGVHTAYDHHAAIVSNRYVKSLPITQIQMGVVPDVQTRRRRSQKENYANIWSGQLDTVTVTAP